MADKSPFPWLNVERASGIYRIRNLTNEKVYIGSAVKLLTRLRWHFRRLKRGGHPNRYLQKSWNKYGEDSFAFEVLEYVEPDRLLEREQFHLDQLFESGNHYNVAAVAGNTLGVKRSEETKRKIGAANRGKLAGRKLSEETKSKISADGRGRVDTAETLAKRSASRKGVRHTEEAKAKMKAVWYRSPESRKKLSTLGMTGKKHSEETKAKIRAAHLARSRKAKEMEGAP